MSNKFKKIKNSRNNAINLNTKLENGQVFISSSDGTLKASTITAGNGISVTNGSGSITISNSRTNEVIQPEYGGTGVSSPTKNGVGIAYNSLPFQFKRLSSGQTLIGSTNSLPQAKTLTAGANIEIQNLQNSIVLKDTFKKIDKSLYLKDTNNLSDVNSKRLSLLNLIESIDILVSNYDVTINDFGKQLNIVVQNLDCALNLPNPSETQGKFIDIYSKVSLFFRVSIFSRNGGINNTLSNVSLGQGDSIRLFSTGASYLIISQFLQPSSFDSYIVNPPPILTNNAIITPFNTLNSVIYPECFDSQNYRFYPTHPGTYIMYTFVRYNQMSANSASSSLRILRNNQTDVSLTFQFIPQSNSNPGLYSNVNFYVGFTDGGSLYYTTRTGQGSGSTQTLDTINSYWGAYRVSLT